MYSDTDNLKPQLKRFLEKHGIEFKSGLFLCPWHTDTNPTMGIVEKSGGTVAHCFSCDAGADIYRFAALFYGLSEKADFPEINRRVAEELGQFIYEPPSNLKSQKPLDVPVTLSVEAARAVYTAAALTELGKFIFKDALADGAELKLGAVWPCKNEAGEVEFVEARFDGSCFANGRKRPCAVWYNGKRLKSKNNPHGLFGRELLAANADKPVLIVEGPKCQEAAKALPDFVPVAFNGGANGQKKIDFSPLKGRRAYILPDDDEAGGKSARATAKMLQGVAADIIIVEPLPEARKIKPEKADICEWLEVKSVEEITEYIKNFTPPAEQPVSNDPYIHAAEFLTGMGFFKIYTKGAIGFYSAHEEQPYNYSEIRDKFAEEKVCGGLNPAKAAKMIDNLDLVYPVYHLVKSFGYPPNYMGPGGRKNEYIINRWRGFAYPLKNAPPDDPAVEAEVEFVKQHIRDIICGGNEADYTYLCNWIAHLLQKPDVKPGVAVYAHSDAHGTGKSLIFEQLIPNMLGVGITSVFTNKDQIAEKFNSWLFESLYVVFSEQSFYEHTENIKSWITEKNHNRRGMGVDSQPDKSYARFVICTNKDNSYKFEETERRMFVLAVSEKMAFAPREENKAYFTRLAAAVESAAALDRMARFFCSIDISGFNPFDIPYSEKKQSIIRAERHPVIDFFERLAFNSLHKYKLDLCSEVDPESNDNFYRSKPVYEALKQMGENHEGLRFIERDRLFGYWKDGEGRNRKETSNSFTRIINKHYKLDAGKKDDTGNKIALIDHRIKDEKGPVHAYIYLVKPEF